jgi:hypothetical protein
MTGILAILLTSCMRGLSTVEKLEDFRYLFEILRENHPYIELIGGQEETTNWTEAENGQAEIASCG